MHSRGLQYKVPSHAGFLSKVHAVIVFWNESTSSLLLCSVLFHFSSFFKNNTFILLNAGRLTHSLTFIKDGNSASSKRHAASTSNDLEVSKPFGQNGHYFLPVQQGSTHSSLRGWESSTQQESCSQAVEMNQMREERASHSSENTSVGQPRIEKNMRLILASVEMFALLEQRFVLWPFLNKEATSPSEDQYFTSCSSFKHNYFLLELERDFSLDVKGHAALVKSNPLTQKNSWVLVCSSLYVVVNNFQPTFLV